MKMLEEYRDSTVIFIGIFFRANVNSSCQHPIELSSENYDDDDKKNKESARESWRLQNER